MQSVRFGIRNSSAFLASRCQLLLSLLLDPDATIRIYLHKRLFLLVTAREE
jgi:hypothetical protein